MESIGKNALQGIQNRHDDIDRRLQNLNNTVEKLSA